jgi:hypothetical protein
MPQIRLGIIQKRLGEIDMFQFIELRGADSIGLEIQDRRFGEGHDDRGVGGDDELGILRHQPTENILLLCVRQHQ